MMFAKKFWSGLLVGSVATALLVGTTFGFIYFLVTYGPLYVVALLALVVGLICGLMNATAKGDRS